jgi:hypothetical protein
MADKYIKNNAGQLAEVEATVTSSGAGNAGDIVALDGSGKLDTTVLPTGIGATTKLAATTENLSAGDIVNLYNDSGTIKARKADASNGRRAIGFVLSSVTSPNNATVYLDGTITGLTGLTPGAAYYLSGSSAGAATATAPTTSGYISQEIGIALSATEINFEEQQPITLA